MFRLYVGNLPYRAREEDLKSFFASAGDVTEAIVPLTDDRRSKGFGFVQFGDEASFKNALAMDGQQMDGRALRINEARPREERDGGAASAPADNASTEEVEA
jgi:RNA recognition motif-containing protein